MSFIETETRNSTSWIWLNRPARHNSLVPSMLEELRSALKKAAGIYPDSLVISGRGASFSTGGDISGFLKHATPHDELIAYADELVELLHQTILDLLSFPAPVVAAINGPVTGGSAGWLLAADLVVMADHAFVQPYYSTVGFAPDGGWTALLPDIVGTSRALEIQYMNKRLSAHEAQELGLIQKVTSASKLQLETEILLKQIQNGHSQTHKATRENIWCEARRSRVKEGLDREKVRFLELVARPETLTAMTEFTRRRA